MARLSDPVEARGAHAPGGVGEAREALIQWVDSGSDRGRIFLEVHLAKRPNGYEIRHLADLAVPVARLARERDPYRAREIAQARGDGAHRPLKTAPNLRHGWLIEELDGSGLWTALEYLYPACGVHWYAGRTGTLRVTHWAETAARQSGIYSAVGLLPSPALRDTVDACCADEVCLRRVGWGVSPDIPEPLGWEAGASQDEANVPCPEPCSMFISLARTILNLERQPRAALPGLGSLSSGEVEQIRSVVSAVADETYGTAREGEFDDPTNGRRVRYLSARLRKG